MRKQLLLSAALLTALTAVSSGASAQGFVPGTDKKATLSRTTPSVSRAAAVPKVSGGSRSAATAPGGGGRGMGGGGHYGGGGHGFGGVATGLGIAGAIMSLPGMIPPAGGQQIVDDPADYQQPVRQSAPRQQQRAANRGPSGVPPANERRMVPDEVVLEIPNTVTPAQINALQQRFRLTRIESQTFALTGTTIYRWRVPRDITVPRAVQAIEGDPRVATAQPNYLFTLQQDAQPAKIETNIDAAPAGDPAQYGLDKLRLRQAQNIAKGDNVLVAVIDSGIDAAHPELGGAIVQSYDATGDKAPVKPHAHGTAMASLIVAHGKLLGSAPRAHILAIRAFDPAGKTAEGTTFSILKGLNFAVANGARVINMSFAGPADPAIHRSLEAARKKGIVLVAAAGNEGAKSPPMYPGADPNVIAVSATDADDLILEQSNRGNYIAVAAPGSQIMVAIPDGGYEMSSGTSHAAAEVSGIVALMLEHKPGMTPDQARATLLATAKDIGAPGRDPLFGAGLVDAYAAITAGETPPVADAKLQAEPQVERVSGAR
ncbi:MAG TPA: S8 family serine peptidase [Pseudolabrys sp.]